MNLSAFVGDIKSKKQKSSFLFVAVLVIGGEVEKVGGGEKLEMKSGIVLRLQKGIKRKKSKIEKNCGR
jgi:hypothetical protein